MNLTELFLRFSVNNGAEWVMWLLVGLSGISIYLIFERAIFFVRHRSNIEHLSHNVSKFLGQNNIEELLEKLKKDNSVVASILKAGIHESHQGHLAVEQAIAGEKTRQRLKCERNLAVLATIGNNAPFIGLLGTVVGVLVAFHRFSGNTTGGAQSVMADISEALAATAIGLFVAIPAVAAFNAFQRKTKGLLSNADSITSLLLTHLRRQEGQREEGSQNGRGVQNREHVIGIDGQQSPPNTENSFTKPATGEV